MKMKYTIEQKQEIQNYEKINGTMNTVRKYGIERCTLHRWRNPGLNAKYCKKFYDTNTEKCLSSRKRYYENNKEMVVKKQIKYNKEHPEVMKKWVASHKDHVRSYMRTYLRNKRATDINYRLSKNLRRRIHHALAGTRKSDRTMNLVGCTIEELKLHLEKQFTEGMSWDNYGQFHIDHIRPCADFDLTDPAQQKLCFHYTNLRPLWASDNMSKGCKYEEES